MPTKIASVYACLLAIACAGPAPTPLPAAGFDATAADGGNDSVDSGAAAGPAADVVIAVADAADIPLRSACSVSADCPGPAQLCIAGQCLTQTPCQSDKQCAKLDLVCEQAAGYCVQCLTANDCAAGQTCKANKCIDKPAPCTSSKQCPAGYVCDKASKVCVECSTTGDCEVGWVCQQTVCVPAVCKPDQSTCKGGAQHKCLPDGSGFVDTPCPAGTTCDQGECKSLLCQPGQASCGGNVVNVCDDNGQGVTPGEDCSKSGKVCDDGVCKAPLCVAGSKQCIGTVVGLCDAKGLGLTLGEDCAKVGSFCANGACAKLLCTPGAKQCAGAMLQTCDPAGGSWVNTVDCAAGNLQCVGGACAPKTCAQGSKLCDGGDWKTCLADGSYQATVCNDGDPCTQDTCDPVLGCKAVPTVGCLPIGLQIRATFLTISDMASSGFSVTNAGFSSAIVCGAGYCLQGGIRP